MYSQRVNTVMESKKLLKVAPDLTVRKAAAMMKKKNIGAVLIVEGKQLLGIFTERDMVFRVVAPGRDPSVTSIGEVMTPAPVTIPAIETYGYALLMMHQHGFRHLPVVEGNEVIGIVSSRNALDPAMEEFISERQRRIGIRPLD